MNNKTVIKLSELDVALGMYAMPAHPNQDPDDIEVIGPDDKAWELYQIKPSNLGLFYLYRAPRTNELNTLTPKEEALLEEALEADARGECETVSDPLEGLE